MTITRTPYLLKDAAVAVNIRQAEDLRNWTRTPATVGAYLSRGAYSRPKHIEYLTEKITEVALGQRFFIFTIPPQHGKAFRLDTPIPTPDGWTAIGKLKVGDCVFAGDGSITRVVAISQIWKDRSVYEVNTDTEGTVIADAAHEWLVRLDRKYPNVIKKHETEWLFKRQSRMKEFRAPLVKAHGGLQLPEAILPIPPYTLGVWLGDGCSKSGYFTSDNGDDEQFISERIESEGYKTRRHSDPRNTGVMGLRRPLRRLGILGSKRIPDQYLRASREQRSALLQGLIDTDGYVARDGQVEFTTIREDLSLQVKELLASLGIKSNIIPGRATLYGRDCGPKYRVMFYCEFAASLPRKRQYCKRNTKGGHYITLKTAGTADTVCVEVEHPSHTFLAGDEMLPTCNSELVSHWTPVWFLKKFPWKKVGMASYEAGYAAEWGGKAKDTIIDNADELGLDIRKDTKAKGRWNLRGYGGGMFTAGIGGPFTGRGFDLIIIDDPVKNDAEALSDIFRRRNWNWYRTVARTRLAPGGSIILIMTRWHEQDLAGALLGSPPDEPEGILEDETVKPDRWEIVNLPALAEDNDPLGRRPGEALWPERYDETALKKSRMAAGPFWWSAQYRGKPQPEGGGLIKTAWFKSYDPDALPRNAKGELTMSRVIQIWDTAHKEKQQNDRSACLTLAQTRIPTRYYVLDLFVGRLAFPDLTRAATAQYDKWNPDRVIIEDKSSGISLIQQLRRDTHVPLRAIPAVDDKVTRANTVTGIIEAGQVFIPERAPWLADFLKEIGDFPTGAHDDIVDVLVHGLRFLKPRLTGLRQGVESEPKTSRWRE